MGREEAASVRSNATDLGVLWTNAVDDYAKRTGRKVHGMEARSIQDVMRITESSMQEFGGFRHNDGKVDKVRSAFGRHLEDMQKVVSGIEMAFAGVKADYDRVEAFFDHSSRFLERLSILQNKTDAGPLAVAIVRVFSTQLSICGIVEAMVKGKRFKQWLNALWNLEDKELAAAYAAMQASIEELGETVGYASYSAIQTTHDSVEEVNVKVDELDQHIQNFRSTLREDVQALYASNLNLEVQISEGFISMQTKQDESHAMQMLMAQKILRAVETKDSERDRRQQASRANAKGDIGDSRIKALAKIKAYFEDHKEVYPGFREAYAANRAQDQTIKETLLEGTLGWLIDEPHVNSWLYGDLPLLWMRGGDGVGKSFIAHSMIQTVLSQGRSHSNMAYFYIRDDTERLTSFRNALACCAVQLAESNSRYAEFVASQLRMDDMKSADISLVERFFTSVFSSNVQNMGRAYIILDGLDEGDSEHKQLLRDFLGAVNEKKANISVLVTARPNSTPELEHMKLAFIDVDKSKINADLKILARHRIETLPRLRKFRPAMKSLILRKVVKHADSVLYIEHMLRRFSDFGREVRIMHAFSDMPTDLYDLYDILLGECGRNRTEKQFETLKTLFAWLAFSKKPLSLADANRIVDCVCPDRDQAVDLEGEITGRSSQILELFQVNQSNEDELESTQISVDDESGDEDESDIERICLQDSLSSSPLTFQDRSLRQYFRAATDDAQDPDDLRTPANEAHVIILSMCADMLKESIKEPHYYWFMNDLIDTWDEHLVELTPVGATDEVVTKVLKSLFYILKNGTSIPTVYQKKELYRARSPGTVMWYDRVVEWASKGDSLPEEMISPEIKQWAVSVTAEDIILEVAQCSFKEWAKGSDIWDVMNAWWTLKPAFELYESLRPNNDLEQSPSPIQKILLVADKFQPGDKSAEILRAIGLTITQADHDKPGTIYSGYHNPEAIPFLRQSVEKMDGNSMEKISALKILAAAYGWDVESSIPLGYVNEALAMFDALSSQEMTEEDRRDFNMKRLETLTDKATRLRDADQPEAALEIYNDMLTGDEVPAEALRNMAGICDELDPSGVKFLDTLRLWTEKQRNDWFFSMYSWSVGKYDLKRYAALAKLPGQADFILELLTSFEKEASTMQSMNDSNLYLLNIRSFLAHIYLTVFDDIKKAKEIRSSMLTEKVKPDSYNADAFKEALTEEWMRLAGTIFSQFQATSDPQQKEELLKELKSLPHVNVDDLKDSHVGMLLANMLRVMGPAREYHRYMEEIFAICISGLEDSVSYNDGPSLRLLAKILSSLDGLERDARIAYSAQFSILDRALHEKDQDAGSRPGATLAGTPSSPDPEGDAGDKPADETAAVPTAVGNKDDENETDGGRSDGDCSDTTHQPEPTLQERKAPDWDEDLSVYDIFCDSCLSWQSEWSRKLYLCLVCPNTDICEDCYDKEVTQRRLNSGKGEQPSSCDRNHRYLKGYMRGWKGIKDGIITIDDEKLSVEEWIKGLKEVRWKKAWEKYWLTQGGQRDIGDAEND